MPALHSLRPGLRATLLLGLVLSQGGGCGFFQELESEGDDETEAGDGSSGGDEMGCDPADDHCESQDRLLRCDEALGTQQSWDCSIVCQNSGALNFTCLDSGMGHACWCVQAGTQKIDSCSQLESCLSDCGDQILASCGEQCFSRTTFQTIRLYGALVSCADRYCADICEQSPESCASCIVSARAGTIGDCGVERSVCDADENDENPWP